MERFGGNFMKNGISKIYTTAILAMIMVAILAVYTPKVKAQVPSISASISPTHLKGNTSYIFTITVTNNVSDIGITDIYIWVPSTDWTFKMVVDYSPATWYIYWDDVGYYFELWGPNLVKGKSASIMVNMTTPDYTCEPDKWHVEAYDVYGSLVGECYLPVVVDAVSPTVAIDKPAVPYYSVGSGNRIWVNVTIIDDLSITKYGITVAINDTARFTLVKSEKGASDFEYKYYYANKTAIPDGSLAVKVTATDAAGNTNYDEASTFVDNTAPVLGFWLYDEGDHVFKSKDNTYYLLYGSTSVRINVTISDAQDLADIAVKIYVNNSQVYSGPATDVNETELISRLTAGKAYSNVINNITLTDAASPNPNKYAYGPYYLVRDIVKPGVPTWESYTVIKGGVLIKGLSASDDVAVDALKVYNGTELFVTIPFDKLGSSTLWSDADKKVFIFKDYVILNLTASVGKTLSIKIAAVDYAQNEGNKSTTISVLVEGYFYPLELKKGWNLISFPIIPETEAYDTIKTWFLGGNLRFVYGYDPATGFVLNPSMTHGKGYWVYVADYDVLLVRGSTTELPLPPALPVSYDLKKGWNLVGYTSIYARNITDYLNSLETGSFYKYVYVWDAEKQAWTMVDATKSANMLSPGTAFWIYLYRDQTLVPPVP
jgi:hypothetical protein